MGVPMRNESWQPVWLVVRLKDMVIQQITLSATFQIRTYSACSRSGKASLMIGNSVLQMCHKCARKENFPSSQCAGQPGWVMWILQDSFGLSLGSQSWSHQIMFSWCPSIHNYPHLWVRKFSTELSQEEHTAVEVMYVVRGLHKPIFGCSAIEKVPASRWWKGLNSVQQTYFYSCFLGLGKMIGEYWVELQERTQPYTLSSLIQW